jgi:integrase
MPRKQDERPFQLGEYYLSRRPNSDQWCRSWFDPATRQTRRASLGTSDLQAAQLKLAQWVVENQELRHGHPQQVPLATVLVRYYREHASKIPSAVQARIALAKWSDFFGEAVVSDLTPRRQEAFITSLREGGASDGYVSRVLSVGRAALNRAWKRQEITSAPFIMDVEKGAPRERRLSLEENAALLDAAATVPHLLTFSMIALNTMARPKAILDLSPFQVDLIHRLIDFNPAGRRQTKKYRPVVPITRALLPFVAGMHADRIVNWHGKPIDSVKKGFQTIVKRAGLSPDVTPYTLRHTMATELRKRGVPAWEVAGFLGHKAGSYRTTEIYAKFDPSYLGEAARAIDDYFDELRSVRGRSPLSTVLRSSSVSVASSHSPQVLENMVGATGIEPVTPTMST